MEWIDCLNQAIRYIEEHLTEEIDYECLGKAACCSAYHFQRMFAYMAEVPLSEYIRRRRMSLAAADLKCTDEKVVVHSRSLPLLPLRLQPLLLKPPSFLIS